MSTFDSEDREGTGYFLPEDSWLRLQKLRECVEFLVNRAGPRKADEAKKRATENRPGDVAICLELLGERVGQVLDELLWSAKPGERAAAPDADTEVETEAADTDAAEPDVAEPVMEEAGKRYLSGVSLSQIDEFHLLIETLRAHGNVVTCADHAELKDVTLSIMGDAICRDTQRLREIVDDIYDDQRLRPPLGTRPGVREEEATYLALPTYSSAAGGWPVLGQHPTYQ